MRKPNSLPRNSVLTSRSAPGEPRCDLLSRDDHHARASCAVVAHFDSAIAKRRARDCCKARGSRRAAFALDPTFSAQALRQVRHDGIIAFAPGKSGEKIALRERDPIG